MPAPKMTGYKMREFITLAINANRSARGALVRITTENPGPLAVNALLTKASLSLGENLDSLVQMREIIEKSTE